MEKRRNKAKVSSTIYCTICSQLCFAFVQYSSTLAAAALQDHISRQISLEDPFLKKKRQHKPVTEVKVASCTKCGNKGDRVEQGM